MSNESMMNYQNQESFSDLFHKFIRMTVKTDEQNKKFKKKSSISNIQQQQQQQQQEKTHFNSSSLKRQQQQQKQNLLFQTSSTSSINDLNYISSNFKPHRNYISIENDQQYYSNDESKNINFASNSINNHMNSSFVDNGLNVTSKPLAKNENFSVQSILNNRYNRGIKPVQQLLNVKSLNSLNGDSSFPFINDSFISEKPSVRLNQTLINNTNQHQHQHHHHHHHHGAAALTVRNIRREKTRDGSLKSLTKDQDSLLSYDLFNPNTSSSSIHSISNHLLKSNENLNKTSLIYPIKPSEALLYFSEKLSLFEKNEILNYNEIYYLGLKAEKISSITSKDYDDDNGCYVKISGDHICYRFEILETLGKGSFGIVLKCFDHKTKETIAIKILRNKKRFQQQGLVEIQILNHLKLVDKQNSFNIVHIKEHFHFRSHLCITFELLGINLYELIKKNHYQGFTTNLVKRFANSILKTLQILAKENIIHCDLKPENILLRQKGSSSIKVIDFGSGCFQSQRIYTYIQSRFYRAPEIILGIPYNSSIDMWSLGCILVELSTGYPIFPGENEQEQLSMIMEVLDLPPADVLEKGTRKNLFFDSKGMPRNLSSKYLKKHRPGTRPLSQIIRTSDKDFIDFLHQCFQWNPCERLTAEQGLKHPWIIEMKLKRISSQTSNKFQTTNKYENLSMNQSHEDNNDSMGIFPRISNQ
ncbi:unnamed protein product [Adineta steineri]|uniref:dual-specificity kinase n=1 Tax=Adineta steineri TaxID=433720 RepID=A0A814RI78_9BILA|nr:unnamed protein product [Adineta steineri]CAF3727238.1 unnamed protein product [Adineta steineri]